MEKMKIELPEGFKDEMRSLLGEAEAEEMFRALEETPVTSVRLNRRKLGAEFSDALPVAWCKSGFYLSQRPEFIFDPLLHAGAYYVQDASSMIYETVVEKLLLKFQQTSDTLATWNSQTTGPKLRVLDLCAAPGGKTTAMINALPDGSEITANEYSPKRVGALRENIDRWGYPLVTVTNRDSSFYGRQEEHYDIVAVDAPCSGEGMMRKEEMARKQWSADLISKCSSLQREILSNAVRALKPGGFLIYSTCTFNRQENECNAEYIMEELGLQPLDMDFPKEWGIAPGIATDLPLYRFMPHKTKGEGLFLGVFRKPGDWTPSRLSRQNEIREEKYPKVEVDKSTAIKYLRGESIVLSEDSPRGLVEITYKDLPLGQAKNIGTRANNLLPKSRRIRKQ